MPKKIKDDGEKKTTKVKKSHSKTDDKVEDVINKEVKVEKEPKNKDFKKYEDKFEDLKQKYILLCKSAHDIQVELNKVDIQRESVLNEIRQLQVIYTPKLNTGFNIDEVVTSENDVKEKELTSKLIKVTSGNSLNKIKLKKKQQRSTDMETDDSDSENLSQEIDCCSESDESD